MGRQNGKSFEKRNDIEIENGSEDSWARIFSSIQRIQLAAEQEYAGKRNRRVGDQAAAKNEDDGRHDEEDQGKRQN